MKKTIPSLALLLLFACNPGIKTLCYQDELVMPLAEGSPDSLFYTLSLEYASGGLRIPPLEQINRTIEQQAFDLEDMSGTLEELATAYRENLIDEYITEHDLSWEDKINGVFTLCYKNWVNYQLSYYTYRGGAHGIQTVTQLVFDRNTGALVSESDLFADGYVKEVTALMQEAIKADMEVSDPELLELVEMDFVAPNGNFSVGPEGVRWIFQPYEAGPYALGIVAASVPWDALKPYLVP